MFGVNLMYARPTLSQFKDHLSSQKSEQVKHIARQKGLLPKKQRMAIEMFPRTHGFLVIVTSVNRQALYEETCLEL